MAESDVLESVVIHYRDAHGYLQEVRVTHAEKRAIHAIRERARWQEAKWRSRHATFTDVGIEGDRVEEAGLPAADHGNPWEGPRLSFPLLLGESPTWSGPGSLELASGACRFCGHYRAMPAVAYCLACDRCGREASIPSPEDKGRRRAYRTGKLKGGVHGKR